MALAELRAIWATGTAAGHDFTERVAAWMAAEGDRRTAWLAAEGDRAVGMVWLSEYRRMPKPGSIDSRWGYVGHMFVRENRRNRGIGTAMLAELIATAQQRSYARLVVSPSPESLSFWQRAGFVRPEAAPGGDALLVRRIASLTDADMRHRAPTGRL